MEWTSLCALMLLLAPGGASVEKEGEMCRAWTSETESFFRTFQCPGRPDNAGAMFCCGSCSSPYCCPSREERLDQEKCVNYGQPENRRTVQDEWALQPRVGETADLVEFLPYVYAAIGVIVSCLFGCCCCRQCQNEELEMESMCPPRGFCTPVTLPVRCVDATSCGVEESCESLMSPPALENTPVVQFGGTNPEYHEDEAINVCSALHVHTTGCGPTLETGTNGEVPEQPWPGMDGDELEQPKDDLEHQLPRVVGKESEELRPGLNGGDLEQPGPVAVGEDLEEPRASLDGEDLEQPGPKAVGENLEEPRPSLDGEDLEQPGPKAVGEDLEEPRPSLDGEDLEQPGPKAVGEDLEEPRPSLDGEDSEQPWDNLEQPGHKAEGEDSEQLGPRADEEDSEMPRSDLGVEDLEHPWGNSEQLRPRVDEECSEELRSGMDGDESEQLQDDLEQPEPRVDGEVLEEPRPGMDGEDPEQLRPGTNGKDLEQLVPRADGKDLEGPKHGTDGKDVEQEVPNASGEDLEM